MDTRRAGKHAMQRMTSGYILPIEPTRRRWKPWMVIPVVFFILALCLANPEWGVQRPAEYLMAGMIAVPFYYGLFYRGPKAIKQDVIPAVRSAALTVSEELHAHGWPTWRDAWGYRGHRPGGALRACLRGYLRLYLAGLAFLVVMLFVTGLSGAEGNGENAAVVVVYAILFGVPALLAAGWLYQFRCTDFDPYKGLAFGVAFWAFLRLALPGQRQPYQSFSPSFTQRP